MPTVSVVIPTYNYGHFVTDAIESALEQTLTPFEVVVVDDGSTDGTAERLARYGNRVRYLFQQNRGLPAARNTGIRQARADWVAFLDSDDLWHREKLEVQFRGAATMPDTRFFGSPAAASFPEHLAPTPPVRRLAVRDFLHFLPVSASSAVVHRSCFDSVGMFDESLRSAEDRDMWLRLAARVPSCCVDVGCWWYRRHASQMSCDMHRMHSNYAKVIESFFKNHPEQQKDARFAWSFFYMNSGADYLAAGQRLRALAFLFRSIWLHPRSISTSTRQVALRYQLIARALAGEPLWRYLGRRGRGRGTRP